MNQKAVSNLEVELLIAQGGIPSPHDFDALFARWDTIAPEDRDKEQTRLWESLSLDGRAAWDRRVELLTCAELQKLADEALQTLNGRNVPLLDAPGRAVDFWRLWKEWWVARVSKFAR